jgi:ZIP family zinc transporter
VSVLNSLLISSLAGLSTLLGSIVIFINIKEKDINKFISFCLSFSISIMIGISITDLIPTSFFSIFFHYSFYSSLLIIILSFLLGFLSVLVINKLNKNGDNLYKLGILSMIALMLHNFPEGIATFMGSIRDASLGIKLSLAIMLHNIPEGISIAVPIYYATKSKRRAIMATLLSGITEPLGALLTYIFLYKYITNIFLDIVLLFVAGIMITLAINEMLPKAKSYNENKYIYLGLLIGIILIIINHFIF